MLNFQAINNEYKVLYYIKYNKNLKLMIKFIKIVIIILTIIIVISLILKKTILYL